MRNIIFICSLLLATVSFSQHRVATSTVFTKNGITYSKADNKPFSGIAEYQTRKGHVVFEETYQNGYKSRYTEYYNSTEGIIAREIYYHDKSTIKKTEVKYSSDKNKTWYKHYNTAGKKIIEETFDGKTLIYSCEFKDNKKHGKEVCTNRDGTISTDIYENGKKGATFRPAQ